jgi:O-antigen/teichoic acid export membrane protein
MTGYQGLSALVYIVTALMNLIGCYIGAKFFGMVGAAASSAGSLAIWNVALYIFTRKRLGIDASVFARRPRTTVA